MDTGSLHDVPHTPELEPATARLGIEISEENTPVGSYAVNKDDHPISIS